jgi:hypothetical protein
MEPVRRKVTIVAAEFKFSGFEHSRPTRNIRNTTDKDRQIAPAFISDHHGQLSCAIPTDVSVTDMRRHVITFLQNCLSVSDLLGNIREYFVGPLMVPCRCHHVQCEWAFRWATVRKFHSSHCYKITSVADSSSNSLQKHPLTLKNGDCIDERS